MEIDEILTELKGKICFSNSDFLEVFDDDTINYILEGSKNLRIISISVSGVDAPKKAAQEAAKNINDGKILIAEFITSSVFSLQELSEAADILVNPLAWGHVINEYENETCKLNIIFKEE